MGKKEKNYYTYSLPAFSNATVKNPIRVITATTYSENFSHSPVPTFAQYSSTSRTTLILIYRVCLFFFFIFNRCAFVSNSFNALITPTGRVTNIAINSPSIFSRTKTFRDNQTRSRCGTSLSAATEGKKGCATRRREGRSPSYNAPLVHCPEEVRKRAKGTPSTCSLQHLSPISLPHGSAPQRPSDSFVLVALFQRRISSQRCINKKKKKKKEKKKRKKKGEKENEDSSEK
ncbi:hypothetical protein PUN28_008437 [Cardiocondyla obscurior]|uniref:Uncharacterized protein n=1 Tax=Cardiocondyla obscurior TaxID=286306 RepID=A0AAW2FZS1_9HYME